MAMKFDLEQAIDIMSYGVWKEAWSQQAIASRMPTQGMSEDSIEKCMYKLKKMGFSPFLHESEKLGQVIQLRGGDAMNMMSVRRGLLASEKWDENVANDGTAILRVATRGMDFMHEVAINNALQGEKIEPIARMSESLGPTIRVEGDAVERLKDLNNRFEPSKISFIEMPRDDIGKKAMRAFNYVAARLRDFVDSLKPEPDLPKVAQPDPKNFARVMPAAKLPKQGE